MAKRKLKKPQNLLNAIGQISIYGTPIATLLGMGVKVYVEDAPQLTFWDNFTFQFAFWIFVPMLVIIPLYSKLIRKKIKEKMLIQHAHDGFVAPKYRLLQTAQYTATMGFIVALIYLLRYLTSDDMINFMLISAGGGLAGYTMLIFDSVNRQTNKELKEIDK
ncbi:MAG: hypothetical protein M0R51_14265 [Clostridia bacterium]|jgi:hypothetical protein|nr:hypothetical protein [Clostridia bacterium]